MPLGGPGWRIVLRNEKYIGHNVYNRGSLKLGRKRVENPRDMWIRRDHAFQAIVPPDLFRRRKRCSLTSNTAGNSPIRNC